MIFSYLLNMQSHPSWVCGLKLEVFYLFQYRNFVTPFVGVWIETLPCAPSCAVCAVTPFVGVWIETHLHQEYPFRHHVTPFVGVWIETSMPRLPFRLLIVTPFVGVWIETEDGDAYQLPAGGHTLRGCVD